MRIRVKSSKLLLFSCIVFTPDTLFRMEIISVVIIIISFFLFAVL